MSHDAHAASSSQNTPTNAWTEPPWTGWIETTGDALLILEAARRGIIPRVTRRLVDSERKMITSGSVFVFDEDESGIKRWTDGFFWSPSRILGNFLLYRETEKRGAGHRSARVDREQHADANDPANFNLEGVKPEAQSLSRPRSEAARLGIDRHRERSLVGSLTNSYKFKPGGMMKKTFSLTIGGVAQHLISYYKIEDVEQGRLRPPSSLPELASLDISPEYLDKTHFRNPPKVEIGVDGIPRYRGEADDIDSSPTLIPAPLAPLPYDEAGSSKRRGRYDPYSSPTPKRTRKPKNTSTSPQEPGDSSYSVPSYSSSSYGDTSLSATTAPQYASYSYYQTHGYHAPYSSTYPPPSATSPIATSPSPPISPPTQTLPPPVTTTSSVYTYPSETSPTSSHASAYPYYSYPSYSSWPQPQPYGTYAPPAHSSHAGVASDGHNAADVVPDADRDDDRSVGT
ncbi:hypothetical protein QCA50_001161 [Cerrena zonata]|uniref:Uncharacterized protein n=1 Tax=Cerrena zonata TaxID=2478898 RepID=A0AAW0GSX1_9APHY